jgi:hypothetical protein
MYLIHAVHSINVTCEASASAVQKPVELRQPGIDL